MKTFLYIFSVSVCVIALSCNQNKAKTDPRVENMANGESEESIKDYQDYINSKYQVFAIPLPKKLKFADELVPLENLMVRENLDREILVNTYWHSNTFLLQKRANRWFPIIEKILKKNKMPDDLKYLALIESGLDNVVSPAGAAGFWQFMKPTAKGYDLEINSFVDERYNLEKSTEAACKYLKAAYKQFGSWSLAAASYNMGRGGVNNQLTKQKVDSYYELYLNKETSRYVYRILAAKLILSNSNDFGFQIRKSDLYYPYRTYSVTIDSSISNLAQFAIDNGTNYATMRHLNPWIRGYELPNSEGNKYSIKFPKGDFHVEEFFEEDSLFMDNEEEIEEVEDSVIINLDSVPKVEKKIDSIKSQTSIKEIKPTK